MARSEEGSEPERTSRNRRGLGNFGPETRQGPDTGSAPVATPTGAPGRPATAARLQSQVAPVILKMRSRPSPSRARSRSLPPCWPPLHPRSRSRSWARDYSLWSRVSARTWHGRSRGSSWRSTTPSWSSLWRTQPP